MATIGSADQTVVLRIEAEVQQAISEIDRLANEMKARFERSADEMHKTGENVGQSFMKGLSLAMGAAAADLLYNLHSTLEQAKDYVEHLMTETQITGNTPKQLQELEYAFRSVGMSGEQSQAQIQMLQRRIESAAVKAKDTTSPFYQLGLNAKEMVNKTAIENIDALADRFAKVGTPVEKAALAAQLFGRSGAQMLPMLELGSAGLQKLRESADAAGAVMDPKATEAVHKFAIASLQLDQTWRSFAVTILEPFVEQLTKMIGAVQRFLAGIEHMTPMERLSLLISGATISLFAFEKSLAAVGSFFRSFVNEEAIGFLKAFAGEFLFFITVLGLFLSAWVRNFADIKGAAQPVLNALSSATKSLHDIWKAFIDYWDAKVRPAFTQLQVALAPLLKQFGDWIANLINSKAWLAAIDVGLKDFADAVVVVIGWLKQYIELIQAEEPFYQALWDIAVTVFTDIAAVIQWLIDNALKPLLKMISDDIPTAVATLGAITILVFQEQIGVAIAAVVTGLKVLVAFLVDTLIPMFIAATTAVWGFVDALITAIAEGEGLQAILLGLTGAMLDFLASIPVFGWIAIGVFAAIEIWMHKNQDTVDSLAHAWDTFMRDWDRGIARLLGGVRVLAEGINTLAEGLKRLTGIDITGWTNGIVNNLSKQEQHWDNLANAADRAARATSTAAAAGRGPDMANAGGGPWDDTTPRPVEKPLPPLGKTTGPSAAQLFVDAINERVKLLQERVDETDASIKHTETDLKLLGAATPDNLAQAFRLITKEHDEYAVKTRQTTALLREEQSDATALRGRLAAAHDPKDIKTYSSALFDMYGKIRSAEASLDDLRLKRQENESAAGKWQVDAYKTIADDQNLSWNERIKAQEKVIAGIELERHTTQQVLDARLALVKMLEDQAKQQEDLIKSASGVTIAGLEAGKAERAAAPLGDDPGGLKAHTRAYLDSIDDAKIALLQQVDADRLAKDAQDTLTRVKQAEYATSTARLAAETDAQIKLNDALAKAATAASDVTVAQEKEAALLAMGSDAQILLTDSVKKLASQALGPLYTAFELIQSGMNPIVAIFAELFEKSKAFNDIMVVFKEVIQAVADVFDAFRPVIDLLLGIVIGVVNVFLTLYNLLVSFLNIFGLGIEKIQLLNDNLDNLNKNVPLLQVTHDIPTAAEFNKGKWGDLIAKANDTGQNINSNMMTGFNKTFAALGNIIGVLVGVYALWEAYIHAQEIAQSIMSFIQIAMAIAGIATGNPEAALGLGQGLTSGFGAPGSGNDYSSPGLSEGRRTLVESTDRLTRAIKSDSTSGSGGLIGAVNNTTTAFIKTAAAFVSAGMQAVFPSGASGVPTGPGLQGASDLPDQRGSIFSNIMDLNLAGTYGNGVSFTSPGGGGSVYPGSSNSNITVNIGNVNGSDPGALRTTFSKIIEDCLDKRDRTQVRNARTNGYVPYARRQY